MTPDPVPDPAPTEPAASAPARPRRGGLIRFLVLAGVCAGAGLTGGIGLQVRATAPAEPEAEEPINLPDHESLATREPHWVAPAVDEPKSDQERIVRALQIGDFDHALERCHAARSEEHAADPALDYREGLCLEGLERWAEAVEMYRRAAEHADPAGWAWALLGQVRCAAAEKYMAGARGMLSQVVLRSGHPGIQGRAVLDECLLMRARLAVRDLRPTGPNPLDATALAWPNVGGGLEAAIHHLAEPRDHPAPATPTAKEKPTPGPADRQVTLHQPSAPVAEHLKALAGKCGLTVRLTPAAAKALGEATAAVDVTEAPVGEVVTALADPAGCIWRLEDDVLTVDVMEHPDRASRREFAEAVCRRAIAANEHRPDARVARVWLANLYAEDGRVRAPAAEYKRLLDRSPHAPESVEAAYNFGLLELRQGNVEAARARFLDVIDRRPDGRWAELGWWWTARTYLDAGDGEGAVGPLRTAMSSSDRAIASAAVLGLCVSHILAGNDAEARQLLREQRVAPDDTYLSTAAMLEALLRYRVAPTAGRGTILAAALRDADDGAALGPAGTFLAGQAYRELGMPDRMLGLYEAASDRNRGPLAVRMTFAVAERLSELDHRRAARARYVAVRTADPTGLGPRAELGLAELAARDRNGDECVARCRALLERSAVPPADVLPVLGRGYELLGEYLRAAEAFAGRVPEE